MRRIFQNKLLTTIILLSVVFVVFIGLTASKRDRVSIFEGVVGNVLNPIQKYLYIGGQRASNFFGFIGNISSIKKENDELKSKNIELENKLINYEAAVKENASLKQMLDFKEAHKEYNYLGANIIGKGSGNWYDTYIIDKGTNQGVKKFYPVINGSGLVGQVMEVGPNWSKVLSLVDEKSRVSGSISRTGDQGMIQGVPDYNGDKTCKMLYLAADSQVQKGDIVVTSGLSVFFPKDIKIGTVQDVESDGAEFTKTVTVKPDVDFTRLREVFVITNSIKDADYPKDIDNSNEGN